MAAVLRPQIDRLSADDAGGDHRGGGPLIRRMPASSLHVVVVVEVLVLYQDYTALTEEMPEPEACCTRPS